jgi:hypothetical protein
LFEGQSRLDLNPEGSEMSIRESEINYILKTAFCPGQIKGEGRVGAKLKNKAIIA